MPILKTIAKLHDYYPIIDVRVIDGDAIEATILLAFEQRLRARIRLRGWWADETTGPYAISGHKAAAKLEGWIGDKALWISAQGQRKDRYGRIVAHLVHGSQLVDPREVLGECQLTEAVHKQRRDEAKGKGLTLANGTVVRRGAFVDYVKTGEHP